MTNPITLQIQIKNLILFFIISLAVSGITAFFVETELEFLIEYFNFGALINLWLQRVYQVLADLNNTHPFISYGYDWLAFGHLIIALFFIGAFKKPIENNWVIRYGMIACLAIFPTAFIAGYFRGIPLLWQIIDCSFGVFGFVLLYIINNKTAQLKKQLQYG